MAATYTVGSLVRARGREWVVLPTPEEDVLLLRPLGGTEREATGIYLPLEGQQVGQATFAWPDPERAGDSVQGRLLRDAVRLNFRAGAGPFRSLGRIAVEPRAYQLVPLLMALKLEPVRLLIADDVGIGKTIESLLIGRELLDRGEIQRLAIVCPPHLCDQWQGEMAEKFGIAAVVVRPGTVSRLERGLPTGRSLFEEHPFVVVSIDYIKSDRRRADFVRACPEFVIVDEAHTAAEASGRGAQQQRHELVRELARNRGRHLILTTATPHSGVESAFRSLLTLLDPDFAALPLDERLDADDPLRRRLAGHLVQRRRADIRSYLDDKTVFPARKSREVTYRFSPAYQQLFQDVLAYARELVREAEGSSRQRQRIRWWAALALLRCVGSSPAAAAATLRTRASGVGEEADLDAEQLDALGERAVLDLDSAEAREGDDVVPGSDTVEDDAPEAAERARLRAFARRADALRGEQDRKLREAVEVVRGLLEDGFSPVVYCRYIATAEYMAEELGKRLRGTEVAAVTGTLPPEAREERVRALQEHARRVLVATDCLSEGINLQAGFDAVLHYDLSWNPTRHEQREGRVDRFNQKNPEVRTVLLYGEDSAIDGAVLRVLLRKAEAIRDALGVSVPVPADSTKVMEAIFEDLFLRRGDARQLTLEFEGAEQRLQEVERLWERSAEREKRSRTIFAQGTIRPEEVRRELAEARRALGSYADVERFTRDALARLGAPLGADDRGRPILSPAALPAPVREGAGCERPTPVGFDFPVDPGVTHVGRTSPLVEALGAYLTGTALDPHLEKASPVARAGAMRTRAVTTRTTLLLLRIRMHLDVTRGEQTESLLAEEAVVAGYRGRGEAVEWLSPEEAERLLDAAPAANVPREQAIGWLRQSRDDRPHREAEIAALAEERAAAVLASHRRVRDAAHTTGRYAVRAVQPPDVLGMYVLMPEPALTPSPAAGKTLTSGASPGETLTPNTSPFAYSQGEVS
jgi:superfamily II DNA or RNA helicase